MAQAPEQKKEDNKDLRIRRTDGSIFYAALPVWFDPSCKVTYGPLVGLMKEIYIIPPVGSPHKLNVKTRKFEPVESRPDLRNQETVPLAK